MNYFFLLLWFIFTVTILGTVLLLIGGSLIKGKISEKRDKKRGKEENENNG